MKYELKHDKLAPLIFARASSAAQNRRRAGEAYRFYEGIAGKRLFTAEELEDLRSHLSVLPPPAGLRRAVEQSRRAIREAEAAEKRRLERELENERALVREREERLAQQQRAEKAEKQRLEQELENERALVRERGERLVQQQRAARRQRWLIAAISVAAVVAIGFGFENRRVARIARANEQKANDQARIAQEKDSLAQDRLAVIEKQNEALTATNQALAIKTEEAQEALAARIRSDIRTAVAQAGEFAGRRQYAEAISILTQAMARIEDAEGRRQLRQLKTELTAQYRNYTFQNLLDACKIAYDLREYELACRKLREARALRPDEPEVQKLLARWCAED